MEYVYRKIKFSLIGVLLALLPWLAITLWPAVTPGTAVQTWLLAAVSILFVGFGAVVDWYIFGLEKAAAVQRVEIYRATVWGSHLVLNNFLNKLYLIQHYAIQNGVFSEDLSESMGRMIQEAAAELLDLSRADPITPESIRNTVSPK